MGLWGAAQALAMGGGGVTGAALVDGARAAFGSPLAAYALVFGVEALAFVASAYAGGAARRSRAARPPRRADAWRRLGLEGGGHAVRRCRGRRRTRRRRRRDGPCARRPPRRAARQGRPHKAVRRRDPAAADPRLRHSRSSHQGARRQGDDDLAERRPRRHADRGRLRRHGRPRRVRRIFARPRRGGRRRAHPRDLPAADARRRRHGGRALSPEGRGL